MLAHLHVVPSKESRTELLSWLNDLLLQSTPPGQPALCIRKVEMCGNGVPYILLLPPLLPTPYPPLSSKAKIPARHEFEAVANLKLLADALQRNGLNRPEVLSEEASLRLIRGAFQANLQLLQWFRGLHDAIRARQVDAPLSITPNTSATTIHATRTKSPTHATPNASTTQTRGAPTATATAATTAATTIAAAAAGGVAYLAAPSSPSASCPTTPAARSAARSPLMPKRRGSAPRARTSGQLTPIARRPLGSPSRPTARTSPLRGAAQTSASNGIRRTPKTSAIPAARGFKAVGDPLTRQTQNPTNSFPPDAAGTNHANHGTRYTMHFSVDGAHGSEANSAGSGAVFLLTARERQFYYDKLRQVESLVVPLAGKEEITPTTKLARSILEVLYAKY